jgi:hypothetical protein
MIDLGNVHGKRLFYTGGRSFEELMRDGEILALPDPETGLCFKRTETCTALEKQAAYTIEEAKKFIEEWNKKLT